MDGMTAWLREQAEADLAAASKATPGRWVTGGGRDGEPRWLPLDYVHAPDYRPEGFSQGQHVGDCIVADGGIGPWAVSVQGSGFPRGNAVHIARHDPQTEAARAESVLAVVDLYERQAAKSGENAMEEDRAWTLEPLVRLLAYGYRHRDGYQDAWKP